MQRWSTCADSCYSLTMFLRIFPNSTTKYGEQSPIPTCPSQQRSHCLASLTGHLWVISDQCRFPSSCQQVCPRLVRFLFPLPNFRSGLQGAPRTTSNPFHLNSVSGMHLHRTSSTVPLLLSRHTQTTRPSFCHVGTLDINHSAVELDVLQFVSISVVSSSFQPPKNVRPSAP